MHSLRSKSATKAWDQIQRFLGACFALASPVTARLDIQIPVESSGLLSFADKMDIALGSPISGQSSGSTHLNWFLDADQLSEVLGLIDRDPGVYLDEYGRQLVRVAIKTSLPELISSDGHTLPNQGSANYLSYEGDSDRLLGDNYVDAELGKNNFFYTYLSLPFSQPDAEFLRYVEFLKKSFPCAMSTATWKRWTLSKNGRTYVGRKLKLNAVASDS